MGDSKPPQESTTPSSQGDETFERVKTKCRACQSEVFEIHLAGKLIETTRCLKCNPVEPKVEKVGTLTLKTFTVPCNECGEPVEVNRFGDEKPGKATCAKCLAEKERVVIAARAETMKREAREDDERRLAEVTSDGGQEDLGIPSQYHGATLEECAGALRLKAWLDEMGDGLVTLTGPAGGGKTRALYAVIRRLHVEDLDPWEKHRVPSLAKKLQALGREPAEEEAEITRLSAFEGYLLLDDLGVEKVTPFVLQDLYMILAEREEWGRPTILTTNLTLDQIAERFDDRIASRLAGGLVINFNEPDYRLKRRTPDEPSQGAQGHSAVGSGVSESEAG